MSIKPIIIQGGK